MDWRTFIAQMTMALAWPAAAVVIIWLFRHDIAALLARAKKVNTPFGGFEAEVAMRTTEQEAGRLATAEEQREAPAPPLNYINFTRDDWRELWANYRGDAARVKQLARQLPVAAIELSWALLGEYAAKLAGEAWDGQASLVANLARLGMSTEWLAVVESLGAIRAQVHREQASTEQVAHDFLDTVQRVLDHLSGRRLG